MQFGALRYFARKSSSGQLDKEAVRALNLPMPADVLEQFILDHGLNPEFQCEYGNLDLYGLTWERADLSVTEIITSWSKFENYVRDTADILRRHVNDKPHPPCMTAQAWESWLNSGTWLRSPVFLDSALDGRAGLHLVEGHTRVGVLTGLLETTIRVLGTHACWVGRKTAAGSPLDWVAVLEASPISFGAWVFDGLDVEEEALRREVAGRLITLKDSHCYPRNLAGLVALAATDKNSGVDEAQLLELVDQWRGDLEGYAGRALDLTP